MKSTFYDKLMGRIGQGKRCHWVLFDPDDYSLNEAAEIAKESQDCGVNAILVGGSLLYSNHFSQFVQTLKNSVSLPVILFPGDATQLSPSADALLYLSLVSGRNPANLIGEHVKAAPVIMECGIEPVSTAYMLVESGSVSSVEFISDTRPLPRNKPRIAAVHALAAQYMGMKLVYLEAGSGALQSVPEEMIRTVKKYVEIPVIVGGGIRDAETAEKKLAAGADIIVTGNVLKQKDGSRIMREIALTVNSFKMAK